MEEVSDDVWRGAWVSSVIRAARADPAALVDVGCVRCFDPLPTPAVEANFLAAARDLYLAGKVIALSRAENAVMLDEDEGDAVGATIARYFIAEQRNEVAVGFFSQLLNQVGLSVPSPILLVPARMPPMHFLSSYHFSFCDGPYNEVPFTVVNIAAPLLSMGNAPGAVGLLSAGLHSTQNSCHSAAFGALLAIALAESGDLTASCGAAQEAACASSDDLDAPGASLAWIALADAYFRIGSHALALATLNVMPTHFLNEQDEDAMFPADVRGLLVKDAYTEPMRADLEADIEAELRLRDEASVSGHDRLESLTASLMFPPKGRPWQTTSIGDRFRARAYEILVGIVDELGWDAFLELRSEVFMMRADTDGDESDDGDEQSLRLSDSPTDQDKTSSNREQEEVNIEGGHSETDSQNDADIDDVTNAVQSTTLAEKSTDNITSHTGRSKTKDSDSKDNPNEDYDQQNLAIAYILRGELPAMRQMCNVWLDEAIDALYGDLSEYMEWRLTDFKHHVRQQTGKNGDSRSDDDENDEDEVFQRDFDDDAALAGPKMSQVDWMRRGQLCERLGRVEDAERAYRVCVHHETNFTAWMSLARLYVAFGWTEEAMNSVLHALDILESPQVPKIVQHIVRTLVAKVGLQAVREVQQKRNQTAQLNPAFDSLLHDVVTWKVNGWDR